MKPLEATLVLNAQLPNDGGVNNTREPQLDELDFEPGGGIEASGPAPKKRSFIGNVPCGKIVEVRLVVCVWFEFVVGSIRNT